MGISLNPATLLSGQGIDVSSLVQQIINAQSGPVTEWQNEASNLATQAGLVEGFNNNLTNLASAVSVLADPAGPLSALAATSSNTSVLTATAQSSAVAGTHQIGITNLATTSSAYTAPVASNTTLTAGSFTLQIGSARPATVTVTAGETLSQLASSIQNGTYGVTANVVQEAGGNSILALVSNTTGSAGSITVGGGAAAVGLNFTQVAGQDAALNVDGVPVTSSTNTVTGVIPGVTLNLLAPTGSNPVQVSVGADTTQTINAVNNFISAYNTIIGDINQQYQVNAATNTEGPLGSDISVRSLQSNLLASASYALPGAGGNTIVNSGVVNLATLGITTNQDGTLTLNSPSDTADPNLNTLLATNPAAVQNFFQNSSQTGFANNFNTELTNLTDPVSGILNVDLNQINAQQQSLTSDINTFEANLTSQQQQLTTEFSAVNAQLQSYPLLLQEITEVLGSAGTTLSSTTGETQTSGPTLTSGL